VKNSRTIVQSSLGKTLDLISKVTKVKRARNMAQAVELIPHKFKTLNSNPSTTKNRICDMINKCVLRIRNSEKKG
jgi:hypothetical protein